MKTDFRGKTVLITGGASGIGKLMGQLALQRGATLVIWDINQAAMDATVAALTPLGRVSADRVDVTDTAALQAAYARVQATHGAVDILINNAGIVAGNQYFHDVRDDDITRTMAINAIAPMQLARLVLPDMVARNSGHLCNIASSAGLIGNPRMAVYVASKWSLMGWSESVRIEMQELGTHVGVTTVAPYYIATGMFAGVHSKLIPMLKPEQVAAKVIRGIERGATMVSMPWRVGGIRFLQAVLPTRVFDWLIGRVVGIYQTMDHFTGRQ